MNSVRILVRHSCKYWRPFSSVAAGQKIELETIPAAPAAPSEPLQVPQSTSEPKIYSTKIEKLAAEIACLNLLEVSELSSVLKKKLNLPDAPAFPAGGYAAIPQAKEDEADAEPVKVKSSFTVKLKEFDEKQKVPLIKEIKNLLEGMNLVQAKKFVESAPAVVKADVSKDEADKLKEALTKVGAVVEVD